MGGLSGTAIPRLAPPGNAARVVLTLSIGAALLATPTPGAVDAGNVTPRDRSFAASTLGLGDIRSDHPRIWITPESLPRIRARAQGDFRNTFEALQGETTGVAQAFLYLTTGDEAYAARAREAAFGMIEWNDASGKSEGPTYEREVALNAYRLGLIYDWIYNASNISAADKQRLRSGMMSSLDWLDCRDTDGTAHSRCFSEGSWPYNEYINDPRYQGSHDTEIGAQVLFPLVAFAHDFSAAEEALRARGEGYAQTVLNHFDTGWLPMLNRTMAQDGGWWMGMMYNGTNLWPQYGALAAIDSAMGIDLFAQNPYLERHVYFLLYTLTDPARGVSMNMEDMNFQYFRGRHHLLAMLISHFYGNGHARWLTQQIEGPWNATYPTTEEEPTEFLLSKLLWEDLDLAPKPPDDLPLNAAFSGMGYYITREGWTSSDTVMKFKNMPYYQRSHNHRSNADFTIYKYLPQAVDSGVYDSSDSDHHVNYDQRAVAHNTVLVGSRSGGGNPFEPTNNPYAVDPFTTNYASNLYEGTADHVYLKADFTNAYRASTFPVEHRPAQPDVCSHCQRTFVYLRSVADWPEPVLIVADDLKGTAVFEKAWLLHTENQPTISGNVVTSADGRGKLFAAILLAQDMTTKIVGGTGQEYTDWGGANHPIVGTPWKCKDCRWGNWRVEVSPKVLHTQDQFLHVLTPAEATVSAPPGIVDISNEGILGSVINDHVVILPRDTSANLRSATYVVPGGAYPSLAHLVVQVEPNGIYQINGEQFVASAKGVLEFALNHAAGNTYELTYTGQSGSKPDASYYYPVSFFGANPTFADVPIDHPYLADIEALYQAGFTAGCATDPLRYCPEAVMNRAESAVFIERGVHTAQYTPPAPTAQVFADLALDSWAAKWVNGLWEDQYTAGCGVNPLVYCPWQGHTRAEGCVFYLRMLNGADFVPAEATQQRFVDVPLDRWYAKWVEAGYAAGLIEPCQSAPDIRMCPDEGLTRAIAAHMMVEAKGLIP